MGCISTKKLGELKQDNRFRVRVVQSPKALPARNGHLELNPRELIFAAQDREPVVWALQHLRRYGLHDDIFTFEAGRRCMSGPGIYEFHCQDAEQLYHLFQRYVNAVSLVTDEAFTFVERDREHPSHLFGRPDVALANSHTNNYLEPAPPTTTNVRNTLHESFSGSPMSQESPDSAPALSFNTEVVHFQNYPSTPGVYVNSNATANANVYLEYPLGAPVEHNNNTSAPETSAAAMLCNTLTRKTLTKRASSMDVPPDERAPMLSPTTNRFEAQHMYANVGGLGMSSVREKLVDPSERCYENLTLLLQPPPASSQREVPAVAATTDSQAQTPSGVNYIVLDLDQPRSPAQCSPKTSFGSGLSLVAEGVKGCATTDVPAVTSSAAAAATPTSTISTTKIEEESNATVQQQRAETSLGYSTIDFIKTCALIKSSTHGADFDADPDHDQEESRITRHSKCVRKAYSISE